MRTSSLRVRLAAQIALLVLAILLLASTAAWSILRIRADDGFALRGYRQLLAAAEIGGQINAARAALDANPAISLRTVRLLNLRLNESTPGESLELTRDANEKLRADLLAAEQALSQRDFAGAETLLEQSTAELSAMLSTIRTAIDARERSADAARRFAITLVAITAALICIGGAILGMRHYRAIVRPLDMIAACARQISGGDLQQRVALVGDREFVALAGDFNQMTARLATLCAQLESEVAKKSRELVRSERLASVGYLAAGVAHEINNPLGIIAGYGERSLAQLRRGMGEQNAESIERALSIMCDETFRCKAITDRLLSLVRTSGSARQAISLAAVAHEVIDNLLGLPPNARARIRLICRSEDDVRVFVNEDEIKQVLLNLLINALAAVAEVGGEIEVSVERRENMVELRVRDNGRGISAAAIEHVFEPFYTTARDANARRGTGLGLSISHAIIADHNGTIRAQSDGAGCGSTFRIALPAIKLSPTRDSAAEVQHVRQ